MSYFSSLRLDMKTFPKDVIAGFSTGLKDYVFIVQPAYGASLDKVLAAADE